MDASDPARSDDDGDHRVALKDFVAPLEGPQPELVQSAGGAEQPPAGFHPYEPSRDSSASSRHERDQNHRGDIQLVMGGQQPRGDQHRLARSRQADPAGGCGQGQPRVVEGRTVEAVVKVDVDGRLCGEVMDMNERRREQES